MWHCHKTAHTDLKNLIIRMNPGIILKYSISLLCTAGESNDRKKTPLISLSSLGIFYCVAE